ncbi:MAG: peptidase [Bacteroidia bacterium]|nr:peptidase [Bacteroidia bacterium]
MFANKTKRINKKKSSNESSDHPSLIGKTTLVIIITIALVSIITLIINSIIIGFPILRISKTEFPSSYYMQKSNRIDIQTKHECAGYATAYAMRALGKEANGMEIYKALKKTGSGNVYAKTICNYIEKEGFHASFHIGNIDQIQRDLSNGNIVIAIIKTYPGTLSTHYIPVVGYDENNIYLAESIDYLTNSTDSDLYNRVIPIADFQTLWDTHTIWAPLNSNTYILVSKKKVSSNRD